MCMKSTYCLSFESQDVIILFKEKSRKPILQVHEMLEMNESHIKSVGEVWIGGELIKTPYFRGYRVLSHIVRVRSVC